MLSKSFKTNLLLSLFVGCLILANILGTKITTLFGIRVSVGIFFVPVLFLVTDIIADVYGKKKAQEFVVMGLIVMVITLVMTFFAIILPPNPTWGNQAAFELIFGASLRMIIASIIAFMLSQFHDVWAFDFLKKKTKGKHLWLRNNLSTIVSQAIDTTIFMFIAFYHITPKFDVPFIISLIIPYWLFKVAFSILDTPLCYLGVKWLKKN
ncbi:MAG: queuosine precursor transporter [Nanoarchaeota archaeon]|nr:queuosine precursor transporter [Nanoarchaeota archaeon]MBU1270280.1 queuosine precursor transporter [Nanoarchaeota archaeon]MBU1605174.1 queuosine precursor transporter [Nanoarchaeota archaeon]MBU2442532.1 queuosine precursor transporter [Nanoarchaeota archaeon]